MPIRRAKIKNPFRGVIDTTSEMNRIAERMGATTQDTASGQQPRTHTDAWSPATDILVEGDDLLILCEVAGVASENVEVSFSRGTLTIDGERTPSKASDQDFYTQERMYGQFRRDITLPEGVGEDDIDAELDDGVLVVRVKAAARADGPTRIAVRGPEE